MLKELLKNLLSVHFFVSAFCFCYDCIFCSIFIYKNLTSCKNQREYALFFAYMLTFVSFTLIFYCSVYLFHFLRFGFVFRSICSYSRLHTAQSTFRRCFQFISLVLAYSHALSLSLSIVFSFLLCT